MTTRPISTAAHSPPAQIRTLAAFPRCLAVEVAEARVGEAVDVGEVVAAAAVDERRRPPTRQHLKATPMAGVRKALVLLLQHPLQLRPQLQRSP